MMAGAVTVLIAIAIYGTVVTGRSVEPATSSTRDSVNAPSSLDQRALTTAQRLVRYPTSQAELPFAQQALRIADQEMDLSFAYRVRQMASHPAPVSKEALEIQDRLQAAAVRQHDDSVLVDRLSAAFARSHETSAPLNDSLQLARARLELEQDEIDDAHEDLIHAGGDPQGRMAAMVEAHEKASRSSDSTHINVQAAAPDEGLIGTGRRFSTLREKQNGLERAIVLADSTARVFEERHKRLDAQARDSVSGRARTALADAQRLALVQKSRSTVEKRADNEHQLGEVYRSWLSEVKAQQRGQAHDALVAIVMILAIVLAWILSDAVLMAVVANLRMDRRGLQRIRVVTRVALQVLGVLLIFVIIFGTPSNLGTIIGLAGAGLTVALKDFIVSFVGWLVLMGRHGVRIGDLVEINGVTGEVVELGVFNTVLHETGNWTDAGHPTGRRVTFTNSYAIEGHYFNFSTSGQWLWDEVRIAVPAGKDPYSVVDKLRTEVEKATADAARLAEAEWQGSARSPALSTITAAPSITIKPVMGGVELKVRFITHAAERYRLRETLYHAAVQLLGGGKPDAAPTETAPA
jgi:small-conductance mechanosensitive channel